MKGFDLESPVADAQRAEEARIDPYASNRQVAPIGHRSILTELIEVLIGASPSTTAAERDKDRLTLASRKKKAATPMVSDHPFIRNSNPMVPISAQRL
jgi:hypothetical protein